MITCKEDLHNTFVDVTKDHGVVRLFAAVHDREALFGREISKPYNELTNDKPCVAIYIDSKGNWSKHSSPILKSIREVTMEDFALSNSVKLTDNGRYSSVVVDLSEYGLTINDNYEWIISELGKVESRKAEAEIDARDEFSERCGIKNISKSLSGGMHDNANYSQGGKLPIHPAFAEHCKDKRTRTEYVKVKSVFQINENSMHNGEFGQICDQGKFYPSLTENETVHALMIDSLYRKVEVTDGTDQDDKVVPKSNAIKVKYVMANYSRPSEAVRDLEDGAKFFCTNTGEHEITDPCDLLVQMKDSEVFIQVTVKWHDDVINYLKSFGGDECKTFIEVIGEHSATGTVVNNHHFDGLVDMCRLIISNVDSEDSE